MSTCGCGQVIEREQTSDGSETGFGWRVVLFNCDCHSFDEVERQLIKAVRCSLSQARNWSNQVHNRGSAIVYKGARERCEAVAAVLEDIRLKVKVAQ